MSKFILIAIVVYLTISAISMFIIRKALIESVKGMSCMDKIFMFVVYVIITPISFIVGIVDAIKSDT